MRTARAARLLCIVVLFVVARASYAQPPRQPPSAVLLKRLAEAVDGNRTGAAVYVVASYDSLSPVRGVFSTRASADDLARRLGTSYDVFGPFRTIIELPPRPIVGCVHDRHTSYMDIICPQMPSLSMRDIDRLTLQIRTSDGRVHELVLSPQADAIFLSLPAIDKFVVPYYSRIIGVDSAAAMRARIAARMITR